MGTGKCVKILLSYDAIIIIKTQKLYRKEKNGVFKYDEFWNIVNDSEKWIQVNTSEDFTIGGSERTKTSKTTHSQSCDGHVGVELNLDGHPLSSGIHAKFMAFPFVFGSGCVSSTPSESVDELIWG